MIQSDKPKLIYTSSNDPTDDSNDSDSDSDNTLFYLILGWYVHQHYLSTRNVRE